MIKNEKIIEISVIMLVYNSETTVVESLESIKKQDYKVKEVIVIDNHSTDNSATIVENFKRKNKSLNIRIIRRDKTYAVSASYNLGTKLAKGNYLVMYHSDSSLPTKKEIRKLIAPFQKDSSVVACGSYTLLPENVWNKYGFWLKYVFSTAVGKTVSSGNCKFDAINKKAFLKVGGADEVIFGGKEQIGGEDADLYIRLSKVGKVVMSKAQVIHLHYMGSNYSLRDVAKNKQRMARAYGRILRIRGAELPIMAVLILLTKPILGILPFIPYFHIVGLVFLVAYSIIYSKKMFLTRSTCTDLRIILLPFLNIFFIYYEAYWMINTFFIINKEKY